MQETVTRLSPVKAIRKYCRMVCAGSPKEVRLCSVPTCPLYSFRQGRNPSRRGITGSQRGYKGRFLPKNHLSTGENPRMLPTDSLDRGETVSVDPGMNNSKNPFQCLRLSKEGRIRISDTGREVVIRLTQHSRRNTNPKGG